jgi:serine/threonine protein kinase/WD40 repeat protein
MVDSKNLAAPPAEQGRDMTPERWQQVCDLLEKALELAPEQRPAFLDKACSTDHSLRREVESLIASSQQVQSSFLQAPPLAPVAITKGTKLGEYEIVSLLGAGGMGEVFRARDPVLKREVAIKVLPSFVSQDADRLRRFEQEAQATAALNHPNILTVHQVGRQDGVSYIVTELLDGGTLGQLLARGPLAVRKAIDYAVQIAHGLAAAHEKGIVHRDLKPENIFVTKDGRVKILDFGLAKLTEAKVAPADGPTVSRQEGTEPGVVLGTVGYMSPEQVRGKTADHRADIFAFGAILYEMLTGKRAFRKPTSTETMTAILNEDPPGISQIASGMPPGLQRIVHRCLEKNPEQRFQSASDLAFALEALSDSGSSSAAASEQHSRSRWAWPLAAGILVALAAALLTWWRMPPAVPVIESVTQLTDDGVPKDGILVSDGSRVYFNEGQSKSWKIAQVSVTGGSTSLIDTRLVNPQIAGMAPDGSALLALLGGMDEPTGPLWSIPIPAGEPRRLGSLEAQDADSFPDGRILFVKGGDIYVADKDGSNPRKLFSFIGVADAPHPSPVEAASVSPDGKQIVFFKLVDAAGSLVELAADGTAPRTILTFSQEWCCSGARWSSDGKYLVYLDGQRNVSDLWALPMQPSLFHRSREPIRLTNGPLSYSGVRPSRDGKQIFAIGTKRRGELVRYDAQSHQFLPLLSGISAIDPSFSRDGQWVTYISYPDHTLWRSRSDGTERRQLTYPPMRVRYPFISWDGTKVAFTTSDLEIYVVSMDGGTPQRIVEQPSIGANWSPDGNLLVLSTFTGPPGLAGKSLLQIFDFRTGKMSEVPSSLGLSGGMWITQDTFVATNQAITKFLIFDFKTQKWNDLVSGTFVNFNISPDRKYFYFTTAGAEPKVQRLRFADHRIETITSLKDLRRVVDTVELGTQINVAPDGSPVFTRDIGSQEIYALTVRWP